MDSRINHLDSYEKSWLSYAGEEDSTIRMLEMYVSRRGDTVFGKDMVYKAGELDTLNSIFYDFEGYWSKHDDSLLKGKIKLYVPPKGDGVVTSKFHLTLYQAWRDSLYLPTFTVENTNEIEFEFHSNSNIVVGGLMYYRFTDNGKVEKGEEVLDVSVVEMPVSNRERAYNGFIATFNEIPE
ncbi:hypothetical protein [Robertkochia aurantiaca]|uniref:hypothetical protein n=1 Tax=Robertkochia aurantiaca TaxID=2873700 RepID=UPI001CCC26D8|nr:hypothetical protein [Robertkochia sp. 3YJGBD-33]